MGKESIREAFGKSLVEIGRIDEKAVVVDADLSVSTKTYYFKNTFPGRFVNVGIAEQNLIGVSAGLASAGMTVFASSFSVFETGRAFEIIRNMVCIAKLNVKLCATHAGLMTGEDGGTHQSIEDIAIMRALPNMSIMVPSDAEETRQMLKYMSENNGPMYLRLVRDDLENINLEEDYIFEFGKAKQFSEGDDLTIIACGPMVWEAIKAAEILREKGILARVINMSTIKPIDTEMIVKCAKETEIIITVEDHSIIGGLGSAVSEVVCENNPAIVRKIGVCDKFGVSGSTEELYEHFGLTHNNIVDTALELMNENYE